MLRLQRFRARQRKEEIAQGWSLDEEHDVTVLPGWVRGSARAGWRGPANKD